MLETEMKNSGLNEANMQKEDFDVLSEEEKIQLYYDTLGQDTDEAKWSTAFINDLPDISFAVIASGGEKDDEGKTTPRSKRHLPHHGKIDKHTTTNVDEPHLKNAAARANQLKEKTLISKAKGHLRAHYKALKWEIPPNLEADAPETFEDITHTKIHIIEDKQLSEQTDGRYHRVRLLGTVADKKNQNERLYPREVWDNNISRIAELMTRGRFTGHADHPYRGFFGSSGSVLDAVLKFEDVWFGSVEGPDEKSNEVWLEAIVIPTTKGLDFIEIARAGVELGVSSRGYGTQTSVYKEPEKEGDEPEFDYYKVNMDYAVDAFDIVYQPAEDEARVYKFEHREDDPMDVEEIKERYPELVAAITEPLEVKLAESEKELTELQASAEEAKIAVEVKISNLDEVTEALDSAQAALEELGGKYEEAQETLDAQIGELNELRPLRGRLEALNHLLETVKGEPMAWHLVEALKECETPEEVDERLPEAKENADALLLGEGVGGKARFGLAPTDAESDEEYEKLMREAARMGGLRT